MGRRKKNSAKSRIIAVVFSVFALSVLVGTAYYLTRVKTWLPSDEEMIALFYEHRSEMEELVRRYRSFDPAPGQSHTQWMKQGDTPEMMKKANVDNIDYAALRPWLPDPYSIETGRYLDEFFKNPKGKGYEMFRKNGALIITLSPRGKYRALNIRHVNVWKDFYFIPEVPRIENGELLGPIRGEGNFSFRETVRPSLNRLPQDWRGRFECAYRQIEPQWFLCMCNGH